MNIAIGNDIVHIPGFKKSLNPAFKARVFTEKEIEQIEEYKADPAVRYATTWAAKEAVFKALRQLQKGSPGLNWKDIEIIRDHKIPSVKITKSQFKHLFFSLSLSHHGEYAFAVAIAHAR
ncbi:MAG: 4'-phosphopantetheinyl transferase superfamily protein [Candidatus Margulisiibacteriota bacterium]